MLIELTAAKFPQVGDVAVEQLMMLGGTIVMERLSLFNPDPSNGDKNLVGFDNATCTFLYCITIHDYCIEGSQDHPQFYQNI